MVYGYSIVPVEYRVPNMIDAHMMPAEVQKAAAAPGMRANAPDARASAAPLTGGATDNRRPIPTGTPLSLRYARTCRVIVAAHRIHSQVQQSGRRFEVIDTGGVVTQTLRLRYFRTPGMIRFRSIPIWVHAMNAAVPGASVPEQEI